MKPRKFDFFSCFRFCAACPGPPARNCGRDLCFWVVVRWLFSNRIKLMPSRSWGCCVVRLWWVYRGTSGCTSVLDSRGKNKQLQDDRSNDLYYHHGYIIRKRWKDIRPKDRHPLALVPRWTKEQKSNPPKREAPVISLHPCQRKTTNLKEKDQKSPYYQAQNISCVIRSTQKGKNPIECDRGQCERRGRQRQRQLLHVLCYPHATKYICTQVTRKMILPSEGQIKALVCFGDLCSAAFQGVSAITFSLAMA